MNRFLPRANAALVTPQLSATTEFRRFLESLAASADNDGLRAIVEDAINRLEILESVQRGNVIGLSSIDSSGNLASGDVYLTLQNDLDAPDPGSFYGAEKVSGTKGWHPLLVDSLRDVEAPAPADGDALVWSEMESKWIPAPVAFSFGNPLTDESGNLLTDQSGNVLTDGQLSVDWSNVTNKPNTDGIPEGTTNLYYTSARAQSVADSRIADHVAQPDPHPQYQLESGLGSAAFQPSSAFATSVQGAKADTALQSVPALSTQPYTQYTVATLPSPSPAWRMIAVTDLNGGPELCFTDGTTWRRNSDKSPAD